MTDVAFFIPGGGFISATTTGFGAIFSDVDQPDGSGPGGKRGTRGSSTLIEYYGTAGDLFFSSFVQASPGDASLSFFGVIFADRRSLECASQPATRCRHSTTSRTWTS